MEDGGGWGGGKGGSTVIVVVCKTVRTQAQFNLLSLSSAVHSLVLVRSLLSDSDFKKRTIIRKDFLSWS